MQIGKKTIPVLTAIALLVTLTNNARFESPTLAAYFLFVLVTAGLTLFTSLAYITKKNTIKQTNSLPVISIITLTLYHILQNVLRQQGLNIMHFLLLAYCMAFICFVILFNLYEVKLEQIYFIISLLASLEAMLCLLQYLGCINAPANLFRVSGTWVNPNVTAMFLAMVAPATLTLYLQNKLLKRKICLIALLLVAIALLLLKCRTAFIGALMSTAIIVNGKFQLLQAIKEKYKKTNAILLFALSGCVIICLLTGIYYSKQSSAEGRKLIWKISLQKVAQQPFTGFGYGNFEKVYNLQQAAYFNDQKASAAEIKNADYVQMAYNEFLQNLVEGGIIAFILLVLFFFGLFSLSPPRENLPALAAHAAIGSFIVMSIFNFTFQAIPAMCLFILYAAIMVVFGQSRLQLTISWYKIPVCSLLFLVAVYIGHSHLKMSAASLVSKRAYQLAMQGKADLAIRKLMPLEEFLGQSETYWTNYGTALLKQKDYAQALEKLRQAAMLKSNPRTYLKMALCYQKLNKKDSAINACTLAKNIVPNRLAPLFSMMIIYADENDTENAREMARQILAKTPKVPSKEASYFKRIAGKILKNSTPDNDIE